MTFTDTIETSYSDRVCTLTIQNPEKRNVLSENILLNINKTMKELKQDSNVRCIILTGAGEKAFSSGYDINTIGGNILLRDYEQDHPLIAAMRSIEEYPYPVIAMINGHVFGAGLELAVSCDIRVCASDAKLGIPPVKLGVTYTYTGVRKFLNLIGTGYTKEMFLSGNPVDASRAEKIGLVNYTIDREELESFTMNMAKEIAGNAPISMESIKLMINSWQENQELTEDRDREVRQIIEKVQNSGDYKEGRSAFEQKRKPEFRGE